ncbi:MAG: TetR/AcrR family transcriptional regulator [Candidatus Sericytochromatia bacterium]|nr:TetR/AcrR family transcriptional regulator [Candidatus Sericytochromatia bacterium]
MDNRSKILLCALELFSDKGYDAVGIQEIVDKSEISKPTMYHYFGNKQGLLDALLKEYFDRLFCKLKDVIVYQGDLPLTLYRIVMTYFNFSKENPQFYRMQLSMIYSPKKSLIAESVTTMNTYQYKIIEDLFISASQDHGNMKGRHCIYASTFLGMINTYIGLFLDDSLELNEECIYKAVHQFMHGIYS